MVELIRHSGTIVKIEKSYLHVSIIAKSACNSCRAKTMCNPGDLKEKIVEIKVSDTSKYQLGQELQVGMSQSNGNLAVILGYVMPFVLLIGSLLIFSQIIYNEAVVGILTLFILIPYYISLYFFRNRLKKTFQFLLLG